MPKLDRIGRTSRCGVLYARARIGPALRLELLLSGLHRPAEARPQDRDHPPWRQERQVRAWSGGLDHRRFPPSPRDEDLHRGDRRRRGEAGRRSLPPRYRARQPGVPAPEDEKSSSRQIYSRSIAEDDTVTVIRFSQIVEQPRSAPRQRGDAAPQLRPCPPGPLRDDRVRLPTTWLLESHAPAGLGPIYGQASWPSWWRGSRRPRSWCPATRTRRHGFTVGLEKPAALPVEFEVTSIRVEHPNLMEKATRSASWRGSAAGASTSRTRHRRPL